MTRAHLYMPVASSAGDISLNVTVRLLVPATTTAISETIYVGPTGATAYSPPYVSSSGIVDVYLDLPRRVRIGLTPSGMGEFFIDDIDIMPDASAFILAAPSRASAVYTTAVLTAGQNETGTLVMGKGYRLIQLQTSAPARVRVYTNAAKRTADLARAIGTDPAANSGVVLDYVTTAGIGTVTAADLSPESSGSSTETTPTANIPITVTATGAGAITVTMTYINLEV